MSSLPPSIIAVKRKLGDEPLDLLYVQTEDSISKTGFGKRRITDNVYRFVRLNDGDERAKLSPVAPSERTSNLNTPQDPLEEPIAGNTNAINSRISVPPMKYTINTSSAGHAQKASPHQLAPPSSSKRSASPRPGKALRRFLLTKERISEAYSGGLSLHHSLRRRRGAPRSCVAVFSEQRLSNLRSMASMNQLADLEAASVKTPLREAKSQTFKRPSATPQERRWREENWHGRLPREGRSVSPLPGSRPREVSQGPLSGEEIQSLKLAAALQQFALEESPAEICTKKPKTETGAVPHPKTSTKYFDNCSEANADEDGESWVYDRYVRDEMDLDGAAEPKDGESGELEGLKSFPAGERAYGVLVIRDEDRVDWEAFATEEADSDEGFTDDEDSNAEDFYANDYPEGDLPSSDEFDDPNYAYRTRVDSSEDGYGSANDNYLDDDSYGFSSADETSSKGWKSVGNRGSNGKVEHMAFAGDDSA